MSPRTRKLLLAFALAGLVASGASSYVHYKLLTQPDYSSACDINASWSCTQAYLSSYGSFAGVPVAIGGMAFFVLVLLLAGFGGSVKSRIRETAPGYIFALSTIALAFVLYLAWASFFVLHVRCVLCLTTYAAVIAIFIVSGGAVTFPMTTLPRRAVGDLRTLMTSPSGLALAILFLAAFASLAVAFPREKTGEAAAPAVPQEIPKLTDQQRDELAKWWAVQPREELPVPDDGAKVQIVVFSDYMCPACRQAHDTLKPVMAKFEGQPVRHVLKHFPLEGECNPNTPNGNHFASCEAAAAVIMARATGNAQKLDDWIFANQATLSPAAVKKAALDIGGVKDFDAQYQRVLQEVRTDASLGGLMKVNSTPTLFLNKRRLPGNIPPQYWVGLIELELNSKTP